jgi:hypothetical protein
MKEVAKLGVRHRALVDQAVMGGNIKAGDAVWVQASTWNPQTSLWVLDEEGRVLRLIAPKKLKEMFEPVEEEQSGADEK